MNQQELIIGIDLGTTNSEVAAYKQDRISVLGLGGEKMLPSCVGLSETGELLVGKAARNQQLLYPDRTARSVKRLMGTSETISLGDKQFSPQEISAFILRMLTQWAKQNLDLPVKKAVITVPAYFSDAQRQATREAGTLAGLEVVRIINEPTAASLAYGYGRDKKQTVMVYDLGGGTFDVSIVTIEKGVTEVLASHGNNRLGGDDFNEKLLDRLVEAFHEKHDVDLKTGHTAALSRLWWAAEEAKKQLSASPYTTIREEALVTAGGKPLNLELQISREEYEEMITPLAETTLESVSKALNEAGKHAADLDAVVLVGGSTRTPLIQRMLHERSGLRPNQEIHPDLCVALGAGVLAGRLSGGTVDHILVDVSPYSFGPSYLGEKNNMPYPHCYKPIIQRNLPLPVTRTERYFTAAPYQKTVELKIYQGENPDAMRNTWVGEFKIKGLSSGYEPNEILCRMRLDLEGILHVEAIEKKTGKSKKVEIKNVLGEKTEEDIAKARDRISGLFANQGDRIYESGVADYGGAGDRGEDQPGKTILAGPSARAPDTPHIEEEGEAEVPKEAGTGEDAQWQNLEKEARQLVERVRSLFDTMHHEDREEAAELNDAVLESLSSRDRKRCSENMAALKELLFFVEGS